MGAESMTQITAQIGPGVAGVVKAYSNARKLFQLADLPVGVLTYGLGNIGNSSIESIVSQFSAQIRAEQEQNFTVQQIAKRLLEFVLPRFNNRPQPTPAGAAQPVQPPPLGFYLAGYTRGQEPGSGSEWEFTLPNDNEPRQARPDNVFGASWRGVAVPFTRLYFGLDPRIPDLLPQIGLSPEKVEEVKNILQMVGARLVVPIIFDGMPVNDAIGFCKFILETTIGEATYEVGSPSCGGPLLMALITRENGFQWIKKPEYSV
ncbi:MAG: hypothetical protein EPN47_00115 [Acidobacteria bacterium]|nr:MAG: hypothetical protein EPN47_00115 [Acidobacteriota bacterium]